MTKEERRNQKVLNGSRRLRIAKGSGTTVEQINKFIKSFEMTQKMMKEMTSNKGMMRKMMKNMNMDDLKDFSNFN
jgi:signal recognition particle subunit SRP54